MARVGMQFLFASTKEDPTKLIAVMNFDCVKSMQTFGADEQLTEIRREANCYRKWCEDSNIR